MPPKKGKGGGGGKKKGGGSSSGGVVDGIDTTEMNREQLEAHAHRLREELEREREERNFFQLERDKLNSFWDITRKELEETKAELRNKDRDIEEAEERHRTEMKYLKQKIKHLLYEHQNNISELKAENMVSLKLSQEAHEEEESQLLGDIKNIKDKLFEIELDHIEQIRALHLKHSEEVSNLQEKFIRESKEIETKGENNLISLRSEMTLAHQMELTQVEERKNMQINILMKNHEQAFIDAKNYYNDITLNNLALIGSLKEEVDNLKQQSVRMEKQVRTLQVENSKLVEPLHSAHKEVAELKRNLQNYERDKTCLSNTKLKLKNVENKLEEVKSINTVLELRFAKLKEERDALNDKFNSTVVEIQQRLSLRSEILNRKVQALQEALERKDLQLKEAVRVTNMDPNAHASVSQHIEEVLERRDATIRELQWEVTRIAKAHDDLICTYEAKLRQYGIPESELGFEPLRLSRTSTTSRGSVHDASIAIEKRQRLGPAGLVTVNQ